MNKLKVLAILIIPLLLLSLMSQSFDVFASPLAATDPGLGSAANVSILSAALLTNAGSSSTSADVDVYPLSQVAPVGLLVGGAFHSADGAAQQAQADALAADLNLLGQPLTSNQGPALDGLTLVPGVYDIGAGQLNGGVLTLNGPGVYIFRASSTLVSSGSINFINGARPCDLFWHVQTQATINGSTFAGTIIAGSGVHFGDSVTLDGRALAIGGDVTLINDTITGPSCAAAPSNNIRRAKLTAQAKAVQGLPNTGGAPIRNDAFPWGVALLAGSLGVIALLSVVVLAARRSHLPK